jgi:hypothetical protein
LRNFDWRPDKGSEMVAVLKANPQQMLADGASGAENK